MKVKTRKILFSIMLGVFLIIFCSNINAASIGLSISKTSAYVGDTFTVNISGINGKVNITSSNNVSLSTSGVKFIEGGLSITGTAKSTGSGKITVTPIDVTTTSADPVVVEQANSVSINIKQKPASNNSSSKPATTNKNNNSSTSTKSSNNYLKTLQVSEEGLTPDFVKTKTNYTLSVGEKVEKINVTAIAEDSKAKVTVSGNNELKSGDNKIVVDVVAENGAKRTYTITVNKSGDAVKSNSYLSNLIIRDMTLTPEFSSEVLEYDGGVIKTNDTKLDIYAYPTNENAKVEIIGNENLILGENTITIKITSEDESTTKEYVIKFIREEGEVVQALANTEDGNTDTPKNGIKAFFKDIWKTIKANALILLMYLLIIVEYVQIVYLYKKLREKQTKEKENNEDKKSFDQFNIKLDDSKENFKLLDDNISNNESNEINDTEEPYKADLLEDNKEEIEEQEEIEKIVKSIWDEDRPNFLEDEEEISEDNTKRRRGRK